MTESEGEVLPIVGFSVSATVEGVGLIELRVLPAKPIPGLTDEQMKKMEVTYRFGVTPRTCGELSLGLAKLTKQLHDQRGTRRN